LLEAAPAFKPKEPRAASVKPSKSLTALDILLMQDQVMSKLHVICHHQYQFI